MQRVEGLPLRNKAYIINDYRLYISYMEHSDSEADAYFPEINYNEWEKMEEKKFENWKFCMYRRK